MDSKKLTFLSLLLVWAIFALNFLASRFYWYTSIWWFDMPMHFLGGVFLAFIGMLIFRAFGFSGLYKNIFFVLGFIVIIGLFWEFFEVGVDKFILYKSYNNINMLDTLSDLVFDIAGGLTGILYVIFRGENRRVEN